MSEDKELLKVTDEIGKLTAHVKEVRGQITDIQKKQDDLQTSIPGDIKDKENRIITDLIPKLVESQEIQALIKSSDEMRADISRISEHSESVGIKPSEHRNAFFDWMANGEKMKPESRKFFESDAFRTELRSLNETTDWEGGVFVDPVTYAELIKEAKDLSPFWTVARTFPLTTMNSMSFRKRTDVPTMYRSGESGTGTKSSSEFGRETVIAYPADVYIQSSRDLLSDVGLMESFIKDEAAMAFAIGLGTEYIDGSDGTGAEGIETASVQSFTGADAGNDKIDENDFYTCLTTLNVNYRGNSTFMMNSTTLGSVLKLQSTTGSFIWQPTLQDGTQSRIAGRPWIIMEDLPDEANGAYPLWLGDFYKMYYIVTRQQIEVTRDPYTSKPDVEFLFRMRTGGKVVLKEAAVRVVV